jgi:hypothetical protein
VPTSSSSCSSTAHTHIHTRTHRHKRPFGRGSRATYHYDTTPPTPRPDHLERESERNLIPPSNPACPPSEMRMAYRPWGGRVSPTYRSVFPALSPSSQIHLFYSCLSPSTPPSLPLSRCISAFFLSFLPTGERGDAVRLQRCSGHRVGQVESGCT